METNINTLTCSHPNCDVEVNWIEHISTEWNGFVIMKMMTKGQDLLYCECVEEECRTECEKNADNNIGWWCKEHYRRSDIRHFVFDDLYCVDYHSDPFVHFYCKSCVKNCHTAYCSYHDRVGEVNLCPGCNQCSNEISGPHDTDPIISD